jgi:hypothetical protein
MDGTEGNPGLPPGGSENSVDTAPSSEDDSKMQDIITQVSALMAKLPLAAQQQVFANFSVEHKPSVQVKPPTKLGTNTHTTASGNNNQGEFATTDQPSASGGYLSQAQVVYRDRPHLPNFSGEKGKGEVSYQIWKYDVDSLQKDSSCSKQAILEAIRKSVRGMAADMLLDLGVGASVSQIISEFDMIFGDVKTGEQLNEEFYMAKQEPNENITQWSCRLRGLASRTCEAGALKDDEVKCKLRNKFWSGLHSSEIRNALRYHYHNEEPFESLVKAARLVENEVRPTKAGKKHQAAQQQIQQQSTDSAKLDDILAYVKKIETRVEQLEQQRCIKCYHCGGPHKKPDCPLLQGAPTVQRGQRGHRGRRRGNYSRRGQEDQRKDQQQDHLNQD